MPPSAHALCYRWLVTLLVSVHLLLTLSPLRSVQVVDKLFFVSVVLYFWRHSTPLALLYRSYYARLLPPAHVFTFYPCVLVLTFRPLDFFFHGASTTTLSCTPMISRLTHLGTYIVLYSCRKF